MGKIIEQIWSNKIVFFSTFFVVFTLSYLVLVAIDFIPEAPSEAEVSEEMLDEDTDSNNETQSESNVGDDEDSTSVASISDDRNITGINEPAMLPNQIYIQKLDRTIPVLNPASRTIADLDNALLDGAVRHPDSASLNQEGNVFILGHSSYLPQVFNKNFQAFNGIQNLEWGDTIYVYSGNQKFEYRVEDVYKAKAQDVTVPIAGTGNMLTLATCNSFGSTDDRYIVEARRVGVAE